VAVVLGGVDLDGVYARWHLSWVVLVQDGVSPTVGGNCHGLSWVAIS